MKVAIAQIDTQAGAFEATYETMYTYATRAQELGANLVIFPAPALMGPDPMALIDNASYVAEATAMLSRLAKNLTIDAIVPIMVGTAGALGVSWAYLHDGAVAQAGMFERLGPIDLGSLEVGLAFTSEDLKAFATGMLDADVICYMPVLGFDADDTASAMVAGVSDGTYGRLVAETGAWLITANAFGAWEDYVYVGGSFVMAPSGDIAAAAPLFAEHLLICDIDTNSEEPLSAALETPAFVRERLLWDAAVLALRDQVAKRKLEGALVLLDGTLASSIVAVATTDALGPMKVSALICAQPGMVGDARLLATSLHIHEVDEISPADIADLALRLNGDANQAALKLSLLNTRLATMAEQGRLLVLSSADKTHLALEAAVAQSAVASYAPFGDVYRSDIIMLAHWRNTLSALLPLHVIERCWPTEGLGIEEVAPGRELGINTIDAALLFYFQRSASFEQLVSLGQGKEFVMRLLERIYATRATRRFAPSFPVLSSRSLDEAAAPLTDAWIDRGVVHVDSPSPESAEALAHGVNDGAVQGFADMFQQLSGQSGDGVPAQVSQGHIAEMLNFLQEMSEAAKLDKSKNHGSDNPNTSWIESFFSDN